MSWSSLNHNMNIFLSPTDEKPYVCSLCNFVTTETHTYLTHVRVQHPAARDEASPVPSPSSTPSGYPKLKKALLQGLKNSASPSAFLSARSSPLDPSLTPVDLCVRPEGCRGKTSLPLDRRSLPSHKCTFCSHSTRYPEVLWMHQTVAHRITSSSSNVAPKWALKSNLKGSKDSLLSSRRRTGPPPVLEGKECPPLPPAVRAQRTRPPNSSSEVIKKSRAASHAASPSSSSFSRGSSSSSAPQAGRGPVRPGSSVKHAEEQSHQPRFRPKVDMFPRGGVLPSSSSSEKNAAAPSPRSAAASRAPDRYLMPQEGLGFMLSSKHGLAEYSRARAPPHSQTRANSTRPSAISHSSQGGSQQPSSSSAPTLPSEPLGDVKKESVTEAQETPSDVFGFLKNYSPHELAALYHRWGATNAVLDPTGMLALTCRFMMIY